MPAAATSPEAPWTVRVVATRLQEYVGRLGLVWVEGQVAGLRTRGDTAWVTLRDPSVEMSLTVLLSRQVLEATSPPLADGQRVVMAATPEFWPRRGELVLRAREVRPVGVGELLARLEHLRKLLGAEGLFAPERKRPLPFLPRRVGLVCGRASAAEHDVVVNARRRWPAVEFEIREVAVQGPGAATQVGDAVRELDALPDVDVIVVTRGGGSLEDLLPFSDETLVRIVSAATTPVVSAIGHEEDSPILDLVADARASTPTHAAGLVVPDVAELVEGIRTMRRRTVQVLATRVEREAAALGALRRRRPLADPLSLVEPHAAALQAMRERGRLMVGHRIDREEAAVHGLRGRVRALSPAATLERGYAIVQDPEGVVVTDPAQAEEGTALSVRVAGGSFSATSGPRLR